MFRRSSDGGKILRSCSALNIFSRLGKSRVFPTSKKSALSDISLVYRARFRNSLTRRSKNHVRSRTLGFLPQVVSRQKCDPEAKQKRKMGAGFGAGDHCRWQAG